MSITSNNLEAALMDQIAAGAFHGKDYAFVKVYHDDSWKLGVAVKNEQGYHPFNRLFEKEVEAKEWADGLNKHIGLSERRATEIVCSTLFDRSKGVA
jgi:hypothetical protein